MGAPIDYWVCSCFHLMEHTDLAIQHSFLGHDVRTMEYRDSLAARIKAEPMEAAA